MTPKQFRSIIKQEQKKARDSVIDFVEGAIKGDLERMHRSMVRLEYGAGYGYGWRCAFRRIAREEPVSDRARSLFLKVFLDMGDHIRQETDDDLTYLKGLRALLPSYDGPPVPLYRGERATNRRYRTYGPSWSADRDVARSFAITASAQSRGGGVLFAAVVEPAAIIAAPAILDDRYGEQEYIVDRRFLSMVLVEERFPELTHEEFARLTTETDTEASPHRDAGRNNGC